MLLAVKRLLPTKKVVKAQVFPLVCLLSNFQIAQTEADLALRLMLSERILTCLSLGNYHAKSVEFNIQIQILIEMQT